MFCPILKGECNPACAFKTESSCCISNIAFLCQDVEEIKTKVNRQQIMIESMDNKLLEMKVAQGKILTLLQTIKSTINF